MIQTWAMLLDAYRELNAKKLFWITMLLSGVLVVVFMAVGVSDRGMKVLWWEFPSQMFNAKTIPVATFYKFLFSSIGISIWLSWGATILALISVAGMIPDFISGGSIEMTLSKPISRLRLFATKYVAGLLFVTLQVGVFSVASFSVIGLLGKTWEPKVFLAVPIVVVHFSYLFCICALVGLVTRSTIAALLVTGVVWIALFGLNLTDTIFVNLRETSVAREVSLTKMMDRNEKIARKRIEDRRAETPPADPSASPDAAITDEQLDLEMPLLGRQRIKRVEARADVAKWTKWSRIFVAIKTPLPKTAETIDVLEHTLISESELAKFGDDDEGPNFTEDDDVPVSRREIAQNTNRALKSRSLWWIIGSSLGFEAFILGLCGWIFCRRDF